MTRIQLESGFIDLPKGTDFPIDLSFAEITKSGARSGGVSRSLDIEGTENNSKQLGLLFDIDLTNDTFNRNVKVRCSVIQEDTEVFDGYIQLLEIVRVNKYQSTNQKLVKYKISVFDEVSNFFNAMGDRELTDLSFPELSHVFNRANIISSWSNTDGFTYPQYAKNDNIYTLRDFKPAIYEYEYFRKIFAQNGYTFTFTDFDADNIRLDKRIIPYNGKQGDDTVGQFLKQTHTVRGEMSSAVYTIDSTNTPTYPIGWLPMIDYMSGGGTNTYATNVGSVVDLDSIFEDAQSQWSTVNNDLTNLSGQGRVFQILTSYDYVITANALGGASWEVFAGGGATRMELKLTLVAQSKTNNNKVAYIDAGTTAVEFTAGTTTFGAGLSVIATGSNASFADLGVFDANEKFDVHVLVYARYFNSLGVQLPNTPNYQTLNSLSTDDPFIEIPVIIQDTATGNPIRLEFRVDVDNLQFKAIPDINELVQGSNVDVSQFIPKKIKQRDLISAIKNTYNLVFVPDPSNASNIIIKTRDTYYNDGLEWDWTDKFVEDQPSTITFLSNDVKQRQVYKYKEDKDTLNTAYQSEFIETYGQTTIDLDNEYTVGTDERTLIYSATPSVDAAIGVPLPSINGINPDCNIRVLLHNGVGTVASYPFYDDILPNPTNVAFVTDYCQTSMFDSDVLPNFSILFNSPDILFHGFQQGQTTNYIYNLHHQNELTTINTGKRLNGYFDLTEVDFQKLSKRLDWKIFIKDNGWFFISKIYAYNSGKRTITKVDLITADEKTRIKYKRPFRPYKPTTLSVTAVINRHFDKVSNDTNIVIGGGDVSINGKYNYVSGDRVKIQGDANTVLSSNVMVMGNINTVSTGLNDTKILGDFTTPTRSGVYVGGVISEGKQYVKTNISYDALFTDDLIVASTSGITITLLDATFFEEGSKTFTVKNTSGGTITITSPNLIDGTASLVTGINDSYTFITDGVNWIII